MSDYKVLIIAPSWVGDMVMLQSLLKFLQHKIDRLSVDVVAGEWSYPLLQRMPDVHSPILFNNRHGKLELWKRIKAGIRLRRRQYHEALIIPRSLKSAILPFCAGIPVRSGFSLHGGLVNRLRSYRKTRKELFVRRYLSLVSDEAYAL